MLHELGSLWARDNETWLKQIFNQWGAVTLEQVDFAGYHYVCRDVTLKSRLGLAHVIPDAVKGALCGSYGGVTKNGEPCKKQGSNAGNRCSLHPCSRFTIAYHPGDVVKEIKLNFGADHAMPAVQPWPDAHVDGTVYRFLDVEGTVSLCTGRAVLDECLAVYARKNNIL